MDKMELSLQVVMKGSDKQWIHDPGIVNVCKKNLQVARHVFKIFGTNASKDQAPINSADSPYRNM
jgi:hypothetical protein